MWTGRSGRAEYHLVKAVFIFRERKAVKSGSRASALIFSLCHTMRMHAFLTFRQKEKLLYGMIGAAPESVRVILSADTARVQ